MSGPDIVHDGPLLRVAYGEDPGTGGHNFETFLHVSVNAGGDMFNLLADGSGKEGVEVCGMDRVTVGIVGQSENQDLLDGLAHILRTKGYEVRQPTMKYRVTIEENVSTSFEVEAASEEEAREVGLQLFIEDRLPEKHSLAVDERGVCVEAA